MYFKLAAAGRPQSAFDANFLGSVNAPLPAERYFDLSVRMLHSLGKPDEDEA
jgi:hypothetical protein